MKPLLLWKFSCSSSFYCYTHTHTVLQSCVLSLEFPVFGQTKRVVEVRFSVRMPVSSLTMHYWAGLYRLCIYTVGHWLWQHNSLSREIQVCVCVCAHPRACDPDIVIVSFMKYCKVLLAFGYIRLHLYWSDYFPFATASTFLLSISMLSGFVYSS